MKPLVKILPIVLPFATRWVERNERKILIDGDPLSEEQFATAVLMGVGSPEKVRVLKVALIPTPGGFSTCWAAKASGLFSCNTAGMSLRYGILIREEFSRDPFLLAHELVHTAQYERLGGIKNFLEAYLRECLLIGYPEAPMEQEAILKAQELRNHKLHKSVASLDNFCQDVCRTMNNPLDSHFGLPVFGNTRTRVAARHALITSDGWVPSYYQGAEGATVVIHISPAMGAGFTQFRVNWESGGSLPLSNTPGVERVLYVLQGRLTLAGAVNASLEAGGYAFLPPDTSTKITAEAGSEVTAFEKRFEDGTGMPSAFSGNVSNVESLPFLGNPNALLQALLPDDPHFDMAVNVFTYQPGTTLPFVETHIMEHGLLMLSGQGVYRLEDSWYPVRKGDVIWMAPYCPQWFVAMGDEPASYLYYKNVNRHPVLA